MAIALKSECIGIPVEKHVGKVIIHLWQSCRHNQMLDDSKQICIQSIFELNDALPYLFSKCRSPDSSYHMQWITKMTATVQCRHFLLAVNLLTEC